MRRRSFITLSAMGATAVSLVPNQLLSMPKEGITDKALMGMTPLKFVDNNIKLRDDAYQAFTLMRRAAAIDGIKISAVSAFRSYNDQKAIWNRKYLAYTTSGLAPEVSIKKIIEYSTMPGTSRHHWGTDIDLIDASVTAPKNVLSPVHFKDNGLFAEFKEWMDNNANKYDFYLVYTDNAERTGFRYEPWHYSYRPLSCEYLREYRTRNIFGSLVNSDIMGAEHLSKDFIEQYYAENILDINPELL